MPGCSNKKSKNATNMSSSYNYESEDSNYENDEVSEPYRFSSNSYYMDDDSEYMGKAMHFAYQEYSGITCPVIMYPDYGYLRKNCNDISFKNISSRQIMEIKLSLKGSGEAEDKDLLISFSTFDFIPGSNVTIKIFDSFFEDNEYTISKAVFYYYDLSEQVVEAEELYSSKELAPLDLTGSNTFYIEDPKNGYYYFVVNQRNHGDESGNYQLRVTTNDDNVIIVDSNIRYLLEEDIYSNNLWNNFAIETLCDAKKIEIEFKTSDDSIITEEVTDIQQLEKIKMWVAAFNYYGYR